MTPGGDSTDARKELADLAEELLANAAELKQQWQELARSLESPGEARQHRAPRPPRDEAAAPPDPRRMAAVEMMLGGRPREEVESYLRAEFGDDAAETILADVYRDA
jgi:phytoene dehydrogenase-like protein